MIRKAEIKDIKKIYNLLKFFGDKGELLPRPLTQLYEQVRDFSVFEDPETKDILGCCALQICWEDLAEIRSLAVDEKSQKKKIGSALVNNAIEEAVALGMHKIFTLTYKPDFFKKFEFRITDKSELPLKIWSDCILCVKFPDCDETAMMKELK